MSSSVKRDIPESSRGAPHRRLMIGICRLGPNPTTSSHLHRLDQPHPAKSGLSWPFISATPLLLSAHCLVPISINRDCKNQGTSAFISEQRRPMCQCLKQDEDPGGWTYDATSERKDFFSVREERAGAHLSRIHALSAKNMLCQSIPGCRDHWWVQMFPTITHGRFEDLLLMIRHFFVLIAEDLCYRDFR